MSQAVAVSGNPEDYKMWELLTSEYFMVIVAPAMIAAGIIGAYALSYHLTVGTVADNLSLFNADTISKRDLLQVLPSTPSYLGIIYAFLLGCISLVIFYHSNIYYALGTLFFIIVIVTGKIYLHWTPKPNSAHFLQRIRCFLDRRWWSYRQKRDAAKAAFLQEVIILFQDRYGPGGD